MNRLARLAGAFVAALVLVPVPVVSAHGGMDTEVTSNYRTLLTGVPDVDGLNAEIVDISGTIRLTWNGRGTLVVYGYEDEPYLRISERGVERNTRSPASYLNEDRYASVEKPATADADAAPEWKLISDNPSFQWHDHRNHWMSTVPPARVVADSDRSHVIFERWEIPIEIDGRRDSISGELAWVPPPSAGWWYTVAGLVALAAAAVLFSRLWRPGAALIASLGAATFAADTLGYVVASPASLSSRLPVLLPPMVAVAIAARLWIHVRRRTDDPTLAMMASGLVLALLGGFDRVDVLSNSQIFASGPAWFPRAAVAVCLGTGAALAARFAAFLIPLAVRPTRPHAVNSNEQVPT